jgi:hypothetical protein
MILREKIAEIIEEYGNHPNLAAKEVLKYLEHGTGLSLDGNGWFDNDPEMQEFIEG